MGFRSALFLLGISVSVAIPISTPPDIMIDVEAKSLMQFEVQATSIVAESVNGLEVIDKVVEAESIVSLDVESI